MPCLRFSLRPFALTGLASLLAFSPLAIPPAAAAEPPTAETAETTNLPAATTLPTSSTTPASPTVAEGSNPVAEAAKSIGKKAAEAWLTQIEEGRYIDSWKSASPLFQGSVGAGRWAMTCRNQRKPTGKLIGRELAESYYHTEFYKPDGHLADGEIVTFIYKTTFEYLKEAKEVVILQPFGEEWKVVSYALKPKY